MLSAIVSTSVMKFAMKTRPLRTIGRPLERPGNPQPVHNVGGGHLPMVGPDIKAPTRGTWCICAFPVIWLFLPSQTPERLTAKPEGAGGGRALPPPAAFSPHSHRASPAVCRAMTLLSLHSLKS